MVKARAQREREREKKGKDKIELERASEREKERERVHAQHLNYTIYPFCVTLVIIATPLLGSRETLNP